MKNKKILILQAGLVIFFALDCSGKIIRKPYVIPRSATKIQWSEIFKEKSEWHLTTLVTGRVTVPKSGILNLDHIQLKDEKDHGVSVSVMAHLLRHPKFGDYLIDSGLDSSFGLNQKANMSGWLLSRYFYGWDQKDGEDIASLLKKNNAKLKAIFLTHLHNDHTAGLPALPSDIQIIAGKGANNINVPVLFSNSHLKNVKEVFDIDCAQGQDDKILGKIFDIFADQKFWAICTPGHTDGHLSFLIITADGPFLLTGDASHTKKGFLLQIEPGWADNRQQAVNSLQRLYNFVQIFPQIQVIYGHEL